MNGKKEGKGIETSTKGILYIGEFKEDKMQGKGEYTIDGQYTYTGDFNNNDLTNKDILNHIP